jgi:transposase
MIQLDNKTRAHLKRLQKQSERRAYIKLTAILMLDSGFRTEDIAETLGIDMSTLFRYQADYQTVSLSDYLATHFVSPPGELTDIQETQLANELRLNLYRTSNEVRLWIHQPFGVDYTHSGVTALLHRLGFVYKKTTLVPSKADEDAQKKFLKKFRRVLNALGKDDAIFFNDGVHPQHNTSSEYAWIAEGETYAIPSNSGRKRVNLAGALNATEVTDIAIMDANESLNQHTIIAFWERIETQRPTGRIIHSCDNARYYLGKDLKTWLQAHPRTTVMYLPTYAPNLNLIERLWKYMKSQIINSHFTPTLAEFRKTILDFFRDIRHHKKKLETLLTLNFQIIASPLRGR